jgi:glycosyltransferase involved in cell wall biosynthesis
MPETFSVLTYLPEPRRSFYGEKLIYSIARRFPDVPFRVVGNGAPNTAAPLNVEFLGYVSDMANRIDESSVLLRLPQHDGKSMLVLEALARGRHVIWNYDFPGVHHAVNENEAASALAEFKRLHDAGLLAPNTTAHAEVGERFSRERLAREFEAVLDEAKPVTPRRRAGQRRVAISGLSLFAAQIAQELETHDVGWAPQLLRTSVRLEVLTSLITLLGCDVWYSIGSPISDRWVHLFGRLLQKPRVIHWVGSDITQLYSDAHLRALCRRSNVRNLAEVDWTINELRRLGINAQLAPLPPRLTAAVVEPLPERFTILLYMPKTRGEFYGRREYERLIRAIGTRARFLVVGGGELYAPPGADIERLGWCASLNDVYRRSTALIRFTKHDGLSLMTLEALTHGRYVLWSQDFPYAINVRSYDDIEREVFRLIGLHEQGSLQPQHDAARHVSEAYSPARCLARIADYWNDASSTPPVGHVVTESMS